MMFSFLYDVALHIFFIIKLPAIFFNKRRYKNVFSKRLGASFSRIKKDKRPLVWVHAVSLGEVKAATPLIKKIKNLDTQVILSTITKAGFEEGVKSSADHVVYLPLDFSYIISPIVRKLSPDLLILTETDFWYNFQRTAKQCGAKIVVINGKLSQKSFKRYRHFSFLAKKMFDGIDHFYVQGETYSYRFQQIGINTDKITITGNLKLDAVTGVRHKFPDQLTNKKFITLGSTHHPEEKIWLKAIKKVWEKMPDLKIIIAPRHINRTDDVAKLLERECITCCRWSRLDDFKDEAVLLVDVMGVLPLCYQLSDVAFVGGSFTRKVGGHNILEPALFGKPVLFGPYMHSQPDFLDLVHCYRAGIQITPSDIEPTLHQLLSNQILAKSIGDNGARLLMHSRGALEKTFISIQSLLENIVSDKILFLSRDGAVVSSLGS